MSGFIVDLWEVAGCDYCGAAPGEPCRTRHAGISRTRTHSARLAWVDDDDSEPIRRVSVRVSEPKNGGDDG